MKPAAVFSTLVATLLIGQASAELVVLKSGKSIQGVITYQDDKSISVKLDVGEIQIARDGVEEILSDEEAIEWKLEQEQLKAEPTPLTGTILQVIDQDNQMIRERTLKEIGQQDQRFVIEKLVEFAALEGNAAQYYAVILDPDRFKPGRVVSGAAGGKQRWNFSDPIFAQMREATRLKNCSLFPEFLPYPTGLWPKLGRLRRIHLVAQGLIALGKEQIAQEQFEEGRRNLEAALIMGFHLGQVAPVFNQFSIAAQIQREAGHALAEYYLSSNNREKYRLLSDFVKQKEREVNLINIKRQELLHWFNAGKVTQLMDCARDGDNDLLRAEAMNYLVLIKLAGEQLPLRKDIENAIPIESSHAFNSIGPGDSDEIAELFRTIQQQDKNNFLRSHANELLAMTPAQLPQAIRALLMKS